MTTEEKIDYILAEIQYLRKDVNSLKTDMGTLKTDVAKLQSDMVYVKDGVRRLLIAVPAAENADLVP